MNLWSLDITALFFLQIYNMFLNNPRKRKKMKEKWDKQYHVSFFFVYSQSKQQCMTTKTKQL